MTNKQLAKNWKQYDLVWTPVGDLKAGRKSLKEMFMICLGETDYKGKKVVIFDCGGEQGSAALWCQTNKDDECLQMVNIDGNISFVSIGKFVKIKSTKNENKNRIRKQ
jgi:hypothetical protein